MFDRLKTNVGLRASAWSAVITRQRGSDQLGLIKEYAKKRVKWFSGKSVVDSFLSILQHSKPNPT